MRNLVLGRPLAAEDVETAQLLIELHQPSPAIGNDPSRCASGAHQIQAPLWPCPRYLWAEAVLAADERGEITTIGAGVAHG